jgi:hypothetical protein
VFLSTQMVAGDFQGVGGSVSKLNMFFFFSYLSLFLTVDGKAKVSILEIRA